MYLNTLIPFGLPGRKISFTKRLFSHNLLLGFAFLIFIMLLPFISEAQNCNPPGPDPRCNPPSSFQYISVSSGNWNSSSTWQGGNVPPAEEINGNVMISHDVIVTNNNVKLTSGNTLYVTGGSLILQNGNLELLDGSSEKAIFENSILRTSGNIQQTETTTICITDCIVDVGEERALVDFVPNNYGTSANFQNDKGFRRLENVCINVTHDYQNIGEDVLIAVCMDIGDEGVTDGPAGINGGFDGQDSGNFQNESGSGITMEIWDSEFYIANGDVQNSSYMSVCNADFRLTNGNFQVQSSSSLVGTGLVVWLNHPNNGDIQNSGNWSPSTVEKWRADDGHSPEGINLTNPSSPSVMNACFEDCCQPDCIFLGGDSDNDGVCNDLDCAPNNPNLPTTPGTSCNDGNPNTTNDIIQSDGCTCTGTLDNCANQGGDSDGDGVCDNQDNCDFTFNPNQMDSDGDGIGDACDQGPACGVTVGPCSVTISGLDASDQAKVFDSSWNIIWQCHPWGNGTACSPTEMINLSSNGNYWVQACGVTESYAISGCTGDPCANQGGDSDGDGVCDNQDNCDFTYNPNQADSDGDGIGDACDNPCDNQGGDSDGDGVCDNQDNCDFTYNPNQADSDGDGIGDACDTPPSCSVSVGPCSITINGLGASEQAKVFDSSWNIIWQCHPWGNGTACSSTEVINLSSNGNYWVQACGSTESYTVSGCLGDPCDNQGGDSDGDGVCDNQDNCDFTYNPNQADSDGDGIGDACDNPCDNQGGDSDGDGVCDNQDNCDFTYNPNQADSDGDGIGDACDSAAPCTPSQLAHWNFNNCDAISGSTANNYNEFIGSTNNGSCSNVSVTNVYRNSPSTNPHSCTEGLNGTEAICVSSKTGCSFSDNNSKAVRFEVTISPSGGQEASLSSLQFYEQAPNYYSWTGGSSGLNNRPTKYGIRVTKNGQEIYKQVDISTTTAYTLENFDFSNNPDFTVSSTTTFQFELLAYCTVNNGSSVTAWDLEDLKVFGCCATNDPCAGQGGDSDGDGVCDNQDNCDFTYNPNQADSDGDGIGDACDTPPSCSVSIGQCSVTISGLGASDNAKVFDSSWNVIWQCHPWGSGTACSATEVINLPSNGNYWVQACGSTESYTVSGCLGDPCANQGGDSDGDGVCDNQDNCDFTYNPNQADSDGDGIGDACDTVDPCANQGGDSDGDGVCDYQDNCDFTYNPNQADSDGDGIGDACDQSPACNVSTGNCSITITGLSGSDNAKVFDSGWNVVWLCDPWGNGSCSSTETISNLSNGTYWVQACGSTIAYTISGCNTDPCANQGGDSDGDGVCDNQDNCDFTYNPNQADSDGDGIGDACDTVDPCANQGGDSDGDGVCDYQDNCDYTYNPNQADSDGDGIGDACDQGPACNVSTGNCSITITGLSGSDNAKVFDAGWNVVWLCDPWGSGSCSSTETITNLSNGTYWVQACGSTTAYTISGCTTATCTPGEIAHWDMDACESSSSNGTNMDYSEFTANTNTPSGFSNVSASLLTHDGGHSCTYGQSGAAICSGIRDNCSWQDNSNDAFRFSVTVNPVNGGTVSLTKLQFYERAPLTYSHINGSSGDNDPPSHYGFRVLKNGYEIYQSTGHNTTQSWSLEQLDLTNDPDFVVTSQTTFEFELLGYCRSNGTSGLAIWDLDEIKVMACAGDGYNSPYQAEEGEDLYFQAQKDGRDVSLYWVTNTDYKNDYFEVERSYDGSNFELIEEVMSISTSTEHMGYNEYDPNAKVGTNFYRIKQIFNDGSFIYSAVKQVNFDIDVYEFTVFPNPATDEVFVNLKDFVGNTGTIQLHNSLGQTLQTIDLGVISEHPIRIDIKDYKAGMHAISVHLDGRKVMTEMLVISKL